MNLAEFGLHTFGLFCNFIGSCCIGHLLPHALAYLVSRDTGVELARSGLEVGGGGGACACRLIYVGISYLMSAASVFLGMCQ